MQKDAGAITLLDRVGIVRDKNSQTILVPNRKHFFRAFPVKIADLHSVDDAIVEARFHIVDAFGEFVQLCIGQFDGGRFRGDSERCRKRK